MAVGTPTGVTTASGNANSLTTASITVTGSDIMGIVAVRWSSGTISSVTWNGVTMTLISGTSGGSGSQNTALYSLAGAATGTVAVNFSAMQQCSVKAYYMTGASSVQNGTNAATTTGSPSQNVSSATDNRVVDVISSSNSPTIGSGQTAIGVEVAQGGLRENSSEEAGATSVTMSWTGINEEHSHSAADIVAAAGATELTGTIVGVGTNTADADQLHRPEGSLAAVATNTADSKQTHKPAASHTAVAETDGTLTHTHQPAGTISAVASNTGVAVQTHTPTGTSSAVSEVSGTITAGGPVELTGTTTAVVSETANLLQLHQPTSTVTAVSEATGTVTVEGTIDLTGTVTGVSSNQAQPAQTHKPFVSHGSVASNQALLSVLVKLAGTLTGVASDTGTASQLQKVASTVSILAEHSGTLTITAGPVVATTKGVNGVSDSLAGGLVLVDHQGTG